jgi:hypothetical protein
MSGTITFTDNSTATAPATFTPPPATGGDGITIEGGQVYTALNSPYSGSGEIIGALGGLDGNMNSIGSVGLITSGILTTITLPADLPGNSLISSVDSGFFEIPGLKVGVLFFEVNNMDLRLHKEDGGRIAYIIYFDRDAHTDYYGDVKKGWHIFGETAAGPENIQAIYDQGYKWTLSPGDTGGNGITITFGSGERNTGNFTLFAMTDYTTFSAGHGYQGRSNMITVSTPGPQTFIWAEKPPAGNHYIVLVQLPSTLSGWYNPDGGIPNTIPITSSGETTTALHTDDFYYYKGDD